MDDFEEIGQKLITIKRLPRNQAVKEINPNQGALDVIVDRQAEVQGVGMGVLSDGTPFLTQRGLARLCGVQNAHIGTIGTDWNEAAQKQRISTIRDLLSSRGAVPDSPYIQVSDGSRTLYAYPDFVCLAVLEYYSFDAGANCKQEARKNYRLLAGRALQDFIYAQVGYDPDNAIPDVWRQFHDRVSLTYNAVPRGYFCVFKEISDMIVTLGQAGLHITSSFVPDISVGKTWSKHWKACELSAKYGERQKFLHNYPSYFPHSFSNPQQSWCYPEHALGEFRCWFREVYVGEGKFANYVSSKVKSLELPASFAQLAIAAYTVEQDLPTQFQ